MNSVTRNGSIWLYRGIRWGLALAFLAAGGRKLLDPQSFALVIGAFGLIPESWIMPAAILLPLLEVVAAFGLLFDIRGSLTAVTLLLGLFMGILSYGLWMGLSADCGCFGPGDPEAEAYGTLEPALFRDMAMMVGVLYLHGWRAVRKGIPVPFPRA